MFSKDERSGFAYWWAHWCAFQMTALNLKAWHPRYLLHDIEKPWLKLWYRGDYKKVQQWHRKHNKHHVEYFLNHGKADFEAMAIDWECSRFTKAAGQLNASETLEMECEKLYNKGVPRNVIASFHLIMMNTLIKLDLEDWNNNKYPRYLVTRVGCSKPE